jgi:hypothetical protein
MTHDELLAVLGDYEVPSIKALRAVVQLHKPWYRPGLTGKPVPLCAICYTDEGSRVFYPCATIQAIEKELV